MDTDNVRLISLPMVLQNKMSWSSIMGTGLVALAIRIYPTFSIFLCTYRWRRRRWRRPELEYSMEYKIPMVLGRSPTEVQAEIYDLERFQEGIKILEAFVWKSKLVHNHLLILNALVQRSTARLMWESTTQYTENMRVMRLQMGWQRKSRVPIHQARTRLFN